MDEFLEDFYYCKTNWMSENTTRVFRLAHITASEDGNLYFYPMKDGLYIKPEEHGDSNGTIVVNCYMSQMRKATYDEINRYIKNVYEHGDTSMTLYDNTRHKIALYKEMKEHFRKEGRFMYLMRQLDGFEHRDIYEDKTRVLLKLLRSYYKCRVLEK